MMVDFEASGAFIGARAAERRDGVVDEAGEFGRGIAPIIADVTRAEAIGQGMADSARLGPLLGLVNNAGPVAIGRDPQFGDTVKDAVGSVQLMTEAFMSSAPAEGAAAERWACSAGAVFLRNSSSRQL